MKKVGSVLAEAVLQIIENCCQLLLSHRISTTLKCPRTVSITLTSWVVTRILTGKVKVLMTSGLQTSSRIRRLSDKWRDKNNLETEQWPLLLSVKFGIFLAKQSSLSENFLGLLNGGWKCGGVQLGAQSSQFVKKLVSVNHPDLEPEHSAGKVVQGHGRVPDQGDI